MIVYKSCHMVHKYGNAVNIPDSPKCYVFFRRLKRAWDNVMLINFPLRVLFCRVSQNVLVSVNNFKASSGPAEARAERKKNKWKMSKITQRGKDH